MAFRPAKLAGAARPRCGRSRSAPRELDERRDRARRRSTGCAKRSDPQLLDQGVAARGRGSRAASSRRAARRCPPRFRPRAAAPRRILEQLAGGLLELGDRRGGAAQLEQQLVHGDGDLGRILLAGAAHAPAGPLCRPHRRPSRSARQTSSRRLPPSRSPVRSGSSCTLQRRAAALPSPPGRSRTSARAP